MALPTFPLKQYAFKQTTLTPGSLGVCSMLNVRLSRSQTLRMRSRPFPGGLVARLLHA